MQQPPGGGGARRAAQPRAVQYGHGGVVVRPAGSHVLPNAKEIGSSTLSTIEQVNTIEVGALQAVCIIGLLDDGSASEARTRVDSANISFDATARTRRHACAHRRRAGLQQQLLPVCMCSELLLDAPDR